MSVAVFQSTLFMDTEIRISYDFHVMKYYSLDFFQPFKDGMTILSLVDHTKTH